MKRKNYFYGKIYDIENLRLADKNARKKKLTQRGVIEFDRNKEVNLLKLQKELINETFRTSVYNSFILFDKKEREIFSLPYFPDRILHHAILQVISPIFLNCFIAQTYSCIPKRGVHKCLKDVKLGLKNKENIYYLKLDIKKFYPNIDKQILSQLLRLKFKDSKLLNLLDSIIYSNEKGILIGNYLSQFFANFYLTYFDHWVKESKQIRYYYRYMNDIVILHSDKNYLYNLKLEIINYLRDNLKLELSKHQISTTNSGINFVGYRIFPNFVLLRPEIADNFKEMIKYYPNKKSKASYNGWLSYCNSFNLQNKYLNARNKEA